MSESEIIILFVSLYFTFRFIINWYNPIFSSNTLRRNTLSKFLLGILPFTSICIILYTLRALASFDVVNDGTYIMFYLLLGLAWIHLFLKLIFYFFDLSWRDDILGLNNLGALAMMIGGFLGITIIYSGANIGDGPGWWTVIVAGGLGQAAWFILALLIHKFTSVFERITVGRDLACGIRFGFYLLASGLIIGRASAGDWTSFTDTIIEFYAGWPAVVLTLFVVMVELYYHMKSKDKSDNRNSSIVFSVLLGLLYLLIAVISLSIYPLPQNSIYDNQFVEMMGGLL